MGGRCNIRTGEMLSSVFSRFLGLCLTVFVLLSELFFYNEATAIFCQISLSAGEFSF